VIATRSTTVAHTSLSRFELALIAVLLTVSAAVAIPEYLDLRQDAKEDSAKSRLTQAAQTLERRHAAAGTYAGAALPAGVLLRAAGRGSYCVETTAGGRLWHAARGVKPASGACGR
jgi:Tfp pilus assembly protein PilE